MVPDKEIMITKSIMNMRKILLSVVAIVSCALLSASPRSEQQALELAKQTFRAHPGLKRLPSLRQPEWSHSWTAMQQDSTPAFYVFNRGEEEGFVIISADDAVPAVLGYSETGTFDEQQLPDNMRPWLERYSRAINYAVSAPQQHASRKLQHPHKAKKAYTPISPICTTTWNQDEPYNLSCPKYGSQRCPTGCVATAASQIMNVHQYPAQGTGSHSYSWQGSDGRTLTLSANFGNTTYDWANMKDDYSGTSTADEKNAVATLMYHCGVACDMSYGAEESGAVATVMMQGLIQYFGYDIGIRKMLKNYMPESEFMDALAADLQEGHPVFFGGYAPSGGGHAFVCDGIDEDGLLHINWGWGGICDGYFLLSVFNPDDQGIGGTASNDSYTENVEAYTQIRPNANGQPSYLITADALYFTEKRIARDEWPTFYVDVLANNGVTSWAGTEALLVYQNGTMVYAAEGMDNLDMDPGTYYDGMMPIYGSLDSLPAGDYELVPGVTVAGQDSMYVPLYVKNIGVCRCQMTVTSDSIFLSYSGDITPVQPDQEINPTAYTFTDFGGYLYPSALADASYWNMQLATSAFYDEGADNNQMCMMFSIGSRSPESFVGSFAGSTDAATMCYLVTIYTGNINNPKAYQTTGDLTVVYNDASDTYTVHYLVKIGEKDFAGHVELASSAVYGAYGEPYQMHTVFEEIELNNAKYTGLTPTQALAMIQAHEVGWESLIPYVVRGEISQLLNTPEQMLQYKNCRLYISDGTSELYCYNTRWLNNTDYTTGNEIALGGYATIVGNLMYYNASTLEMNSGYFCAYETEAEQPEPLEYDAETDFAEDFPTYNVDDTHLYNDGYAFVEATNDNNAYINLIFLVGSGEDEIPAATYPIDTTFAIGNVYAGQGVDAEGYIIGSFADYLNKQNQFTIPLWFLVSGTVTVDGKGVITVRATNSYGKSVTCTLHQRDEDAIEDVVADGEMHAARKVMHDGQIYIIRDGVIYTIQGLRVAGSPAVR